MPIVAQYIKEARRLKVSTRQILENKIIAMRCAWRYLTPDEMQTEYDLGLSKLEYLKAHLKLLKDWPK